MEMMEIVTQQVDGYIVIHFYNYHRSLLHGSLRLLTPATLGSVGEYPCEYPRSFGSAIRTFSFDTSTFNSESIYDAESRLIWNALIKTGWRKHRITRYK
jgi:hypothetical protein